MWLGWRGQTFSTGLLSLRRLLPTRQLSIVCIFHRGPFKTKGKVKWAPLEVLDKGKSSQSKASLVDRVPAALLRRVQTSFNTSSVSSQQKVLPSERPRYPAAAVGGWHGFILSPLVPKGHPQEMTSRSKPCQSARRGKYPLMELGWRSGYGPLGRRCSSDSLNPPMEEF